MELADHHAPDVDPVADEAAVLRGADYRITVLTPRVLRLEYAPDGSFEDRASQRVWFRDLPVPDYEATATDDRVELDTAALSLRFDRGRGGPGFTRESLSVHVHDTGAVWHYGDGPTAGQDAGRRGSGGDGADPVGAGDAGASDDAAGNLRGALRTLDRTEGPTDLDPGLVSRAGWGVLDDTDALVFGENGWVRPRDAHDDYEDVYVFAYGHDYLAALDDVTDLAGDVPLVPRWALGNWWSRYDEYGQDELRALLETFREHGLPLSVCILDMDWHVVDNPYTGGWTGWTWSPERFPEPASFVDWLHEEGLRTGLNLHPDGGVHPHEARYAAIAERLGIDPASGEPVPFDASDPTFWRGYFEDLLHPIEDGQDVDFWWVDWQQHDESPGMAGLDPLWALNHLHALDRTRDGRRPFVLSRWPGIGGHRSPVGFSGDAVISWRSLAFQPHLTATGGNVGCDWWSHDVGGHFGGTGAPRTFGELYVRWAQFGALSPINRIHTGNIEYVRKRPWRFDPTRFSALAAAFRLRHALVPYLYTAARRTHESGVPLVRPVYYHHPEPEAAYHCPGEYYLGPELLAAPHVAPRDDGTNLARTVVWLPDRDGRGGASVGGAGAGEGGVGARAGARTAGAGSPGEEVDPARVWFDALTGERYRAGYHARYGELDDVPLYARAGAIVPLDGDVSWGAPDAPERLRVLAFPGADNAFGLYEDDGVSQDYLGSAGDGEGGARAGADGASEGDEDGQNRDLARAITEFSQTWEGDWLAFEVAPVRGDRSLVPVERDYEVAFRGVPDPDEAAVTVTVGVDGADREPDVSYDADVATLTVVVEGVEPDERVRIALDADHAGGAGGSPLLAPPADPLDRLGDLLRHLELPARSKGRLLEHARATRAGETDLSWLGNFAHVTAPAQVRAIVETLCDVGVERIDHDGDERYLLWNGEGREDATVRLETWDRGGIPLSEEGAVDRGALPPFRIFDPDDWARHDWRLVVAYGGEVAATFEGEGEPEAYEGEV
jgi:hypothetical protein